MRNGAEFQEAQLAALPPEDDLLTIPANLFPDTVADGNGSCSPPPVLISSDSNKETVPAIVFGDLLYKDKLRHTLD